MGSEKKIFEHFFENLPYMSPCQPIKLSDLDKSRMKHGGLPHKHFCKKNQISSMTQQTLSATRVLTRPEQKKNFCGCVDAMCVIRKESATWLQRKSRLKMLTDDGRTPDACLH